MIPQFFTSSSEILCMWFPTSSGKVFLLCCGLPHIFVVFALWILNDFTTISDVSVKIQKYQPKGCIAQQIFLCSRISWIMNICKSWSSVHVWRWEWIFCINVLNLVHSTDSKFLKITRKHLRAFTSESQNWRYNPRYNHRICFIIKNTSNHRIQNCFKFFFNNVYMYVIRRWITKYIKYAKSYS